jgi:hypothetical protein
MKCSAGCCFLYILNTEQSVFIPNDEDGREPAFTEMRGVFQEKVVCSSGEMITWKRKSECEFW